ncbi:hypothetical protein [Pedobacter sp. JCM 36344]|uniref:hypothetical protein n=1 Tax=Pedobacter sp. JCM 36344 TaxID=3374280 RepID=UPI00397A6A55
MFKSLVTLLLVFPVIAFGQKGVTIKVEQLEKPTSLIKLTATERIYHEMMMTDADLSVFEVEIKLVK